MTLGNMREQGVRSLSVLRPIRPRWKACAALPGIKVAATPNSEPRNGLTQNCRVMYAFM